MLICRVLVFVVLMTVAVDAPKRIVRGPCVDPLVQKRLPSTLGAERRFQALDVATEEVLASSTPLPSTRPMTRETAELLVTAAPGAASKPDTTSNGQSW